MTQPKHFLPRYDLPPLVPKERAELVAELPVAKAGAFVELEGELVRRRHAQTLWELLSQLQRDRQATALYFEAYPALRADLIERGLVCLELQLYPLALQLFCFAISLEGDALCYAAQGDCLMGLQQWEGAMAAYRRVIALAPSVPDAYLRLAEVAMMSKQPQEAIEVLEQLFLRLDCVSHPLAAVAKQRHGFAKEAANRE